MNYLFNKTVNIIDKIANHWGVKSKISAFLILITFSLTGISILYIKNPIVNFILPESSKDSTKTIIYILLIFPLYQILLLIYGFLLGQSYFFWKKFKKLIKFFYFR